MITASHNPPEYIGIKLWNPSGLGFSTKQEGEIERIYLERSFKKTDWRGIGTVIPIFDVNSIHIEDVMEKIKIPENNNLSVIVDPGHGCSAEILTRLLNKYQIKYMTINAQMDGTFPGRQSEPNEKNLNQLCKLVCFSEAADIGIALDGDADRVIFVDEDGNLVDSIRLLALCAKDIIMENGDIPEVDKKVASPINSSSVLERVLNPIGCEVIRTEVGDIKVATALKENGGILGGETSGTFVWPKYHYGPDSIATIAYVLEMINRRGIPLKELLKEIPEFPFVRSSFPLQRDIPFTDLVNDKIIREIQTLFQDLNLNTLRKNRLDGIRFDHSNGLVMIRRSGTSPLLRISVESTIDIEEGQKMLQLAKERMENINLI
jgi:phosphoglucosamine mutase